ncbi:YndJ family protein [Streptomyces sp. NBC_01264]|uniref:YndJ family protein n=1 Tax=Streptomyces sp. NBC_01264 TaxID=2903804 RepID=UPI002258B315|nr:YndJ family protein [Streptomyces sp. NBC_01264]MCX4782547.1 YndJ family protein [Streptomyces sp. NBC_01264]
MTVLVNLIVALGMLYVVPAGLRLIDPVRFGRTARLWPLFAAPGAVCLWLPRGAPATALAALYAAATLALAVRAPVPAVRALVPAVRGPGWAVRAATPGRGTGPGPGPGLGPGPGPGPGPAEVAVLTALVAPSVAGTALVAERAGHRLFGFDLDILALTVPHFHFAGFTAALVAGLVCRASAAGALARWAAYSVPAGTGLVLLGYFIDDWAELVGAVTLTGGMWAVALLTWRDVRPGARGRDRITGALLACSAVVLVATMLLALWWALGEATGIVHPTLTWMAATHGLGNALGFGLCSLLAWRRLTTSAARPAPAPSPTPAPAPTPASAPAALPDRTEIPA